MPYLVLSRFPRAISALLLTLSVLLSSQSSWAEVGVTATEILLGQSTALEGTASTGRPIQEGTNLCLEKVNLAGGVFGRKLKLLTYDDGYDPRRNFDNLKKLVEVDKVFAIIQNFGSAAAKAALPQIEAWNIPFFGPIASAEDIRVPVRRNVFTVRASSISEIQALAQHLVKALKINEIAILTQSDASGSGIRLAALKALHDLQVQPALDETIPSNSMGVKLLVDKLLQSKAKAVILGIQTKAALQLIHEAKLKGATPVWAANTSAANPEFLAGVNSEGANVYLSSGYPVLFKNSKIKLVQEYLAEADKAKRPADPAGFEGYLNTTVFVEALKRAGPQLTRDSLRDALEAMNDVEIGGIHLKYSPKSHRGLESAEVAHVVEGGLVPVHP